MITLRTNAAPAATARQNRHLSEPVQTESLLTAKIVEWSRPKGFGFLQVGNQRIFLHRRDFIAHHKPPAVGDAINFRLGQDGQGRICATNATHVNDGGRITILSALVLLGLLVLPVFALLRHLVDLRWVIAHILVLGAVTYLAYAWDKQRARAKEWRLSEQGLHLLELLGGWPGAFLAQRRLRHKCSKGSYQFMFWLIVLAYQFAAIDSFQNWKLSRAALQHLERSSDHRR
jgi:uncharacterized membrane protein YsdA (DUF1294 family)/cold shock CspA family protein